MVRTVWRTPMKGLRMSDHDSQGTALDTYAEALDRFARAGDPRMAQQVVDSMRQRHVELGPVHHELLVKAYLGGNDLANALRRVAEMERAGFPLEPSAKFNLAVAAAKAGRREMAAKLADELDAVGFRAGQEDLGRAFSLFVQLRRLPLARSLMPAMVSNAITGAPADYAVILDDCLTRRAIKDTRHVIESMLASGVAPDVSRATALVTMMAGAGHADRARELLDILAAGGVAVESAAWESLVQAAQKAGDTAKVQATIEEMAAAGVAPNSHHRNMMLATSAGTDPETAWTALSAFADEGLIPTGENLETVFDTMLKAGDVRRAQGVLDWMVILGVPLPASKVADLVGALLKSGELDRALEAFDEALALGIPGDRKQGSGLLHELIRAGRLDDANAFLRRARKARVLTHGRHFGAMVVGFIRGERLDDGLTLLDQMIARKSAPSSADAGKVVAAVLRTGDLERTLKVVTDLASVDVHVDEPTYRELLWAYAKKRNAPQAEAIHKLMVAAGISPNAGHEAAMKWARGETAQNLEEARAEAEQKVIALTDKNMATVAAAQAAEPAADKALEPEAAAEAAAEPAVEPVAEAAAVEPDPEVAAIEPEPEAAVVEPEPEVAAVEPEPVADAPAPEPEPDLPGTEAVQIRDAEIVMDPPKLDGLVVRENGVVESADEPVPAAEAPEPEPVVEAAEPEAAPPTHVTPTPTPAPRGPSQAPPLLRKPNA